MGRRSQGSVQLVPPHGFDLAAAPGHLIRRAQQLHTTLWGELVGSELTSVQFAILVALEAEPGMDQRTLGKRISLDTSSLAEVCGRLVERRLVARERDPVDGRRNLLSLTTSGRRALHEATPRVHEVGMRLLEPFSPGEQEELMRLLTRLVSG
jgi:DNA-binding MarR family transcriptional regulator